jgi:5-methylcytosine-specific restriction enzyme A
MKIPSIQRKSRSREFDAYSDELRASVVRGWLFLGKTHRELDEEVLGLDRALTKGYQSMGILHFLGLKKEFRNIFNGLSDSKAVAILEADSQDFSHIISYLKGNPVNTLVNLLSLRDEEAKAIEKSSQKSSESRKTQIASAPKQPERLRVYSYTYRRNPDIVAEALSQANGICDKCKKPAPFYRVSDGTPFLEVHHLVPLADGGTDTLENVRALCPNCHREEHYGQS